MKLNLCNLSLAMLLGTTALAGTDQDLKTPILEKDIPASTAPVMEKTSWKPGDPISFADGKVVFDVQERLRFEWRNNNFDFNDSRNHNTDDAYFLQRFRLGMAVKPLSWLKLYVQGQDSREVMSDRQDEPFIFGSEGDDTFDLREAYVELGDPAKFPVMLKVGRQALSYGDERLIGSFDWNNFGRTFDAIKLTYQADPIKTSFDFFAGNVVHIEGYDFPENHEWEWNDSDRHDLLVGMYASSKIISFQKTEAYLIYRDKTQSNPVYATRGGGANFPYDIDQEVWTLGGRIVSTSPGRLKGFDYEADFAFQTGTVANRVGAAFPSNSSLDHTAFAGHVAGGYNWELAPWTPRLGVDYALATGDEDPNDRQSNSFMNLFPTNHKFYGYMDFFGWKNIHDLSYNLQAKPNDKITLRIDHHFFWLFTSDDSWYRANAVNIVRPPSVASRTSNNYVGSEVDFTATYNYSKWLSFLVGYSHFFSGDYVNNTQTKPLVPQGAAPVAGPDDADFIYVQSTLKF